MQKKNFYFISFASIGDFLIDIVLAKNIRQDSLLQKNIDARLFIIIPKQNNFLQEIIKHYEYIDLIVLDDFKKKILFYFKNFYKLNFIFTVPTFGSMPIELKIFGFLITRRPGSKFIGFNDKSGINKYFYDKEIIFDYHQPYYENLLKILDFLKINYSKEPPFLDIQIDEKLVDSKFTQYADKSYIVLHVCGKNITRSWPVDNWVKFINYFHQNYPDHSIIMTGSKQDANFINQIINNLPTADFIKNFSGQLSFNELLFLLKNSKLYIGVDTGITHLASLLNLPSLVIGNLSNPTWLPDYNPLASILFNKENCTCKGDKSGECYYLIDNKKYYRCMMDIKFDDVTNALKKYLN